MDPVSALSVASTAVTIAFAIGTSIKNLKLLKEKLGLAGTVIDVLERRLVTISFSIDSLVQWEKNRKDDSPYSAEFSAALRLSLEGCSTMLSSLDDQVAKFHDESGELSLFHGGRYVWNEGVLKEYLDNLDNEIQALRLLLACHQTRTLQEQVELLRERKNQEILRDVREDTESLRRQSGEYTRPEIQSPVNVARSLGKNRAFDSSILSSSAPAPPLYSRQTEPSLSKSSTELLLAVKSLPARRFGRKRASSSPLQAEEHTSETQTPTRKRSLSESLRKLAATKSPLPTHNSDTGIPLSQTPVRDSFDFSRSQPLASPAMASSCPSRLSDTLSALSALSESRSAVRTGAASPTFSRKRENGASSPTSMRKSQSRSSSSKLPAIEDDHGEGVAMPGSKGADDASASTSRSIWWEATIPQRSSTRNLAAHRHIFSRRHATSLLSSQFSASSRATHGASQTPPPHTAILTTVMSAAPAFPAAILPSHTPTPAATPGASLDAEANVWEPSFHLAAAEATPIHVMTQQFEEPYADDAVIADGGPPFSNDDCATWFDPGFAPSTPIPIPSRNVWLQLQ